MVMALQVVSDRSYQFEDFVRIPRIVYKTMGYDFVKTKRSKWWRFFSYIFIAIMISTGCCCRFSIYRQLYSNICNKDWTKIIPTATYLSFSFDSLIKLFAFGVNHKRMLKIYHTLQTAYPQTKKEHSIYKVHEYYWSQSMRFVFKFYAVASTAVTLGPLCQSAAVYLHEAAVHGFAGAHFPYLKSLPSLYPFNYQTPAAYVFIYCIEISYSISAVCSNIGTDLWLMSYSMQLIMHMDYIIRTLEGYEPHVNSARKDCEFLAVLIRKQQMIFNLINELNAIFGISLIFTIMATTFCLCLLTIQLTIEGLGVESLKFCSFLASYLAQFYLVCYFGQKLIDVSLKVPIAAYNSKWYQASPAYKKLLLILMTRAQEPAMLSAKGFQPLSLDTFKIVMRMTYRVFAVVRTVLEN